MKLFNYNKIFFLLFIVLILSILSPISYAEYDDRVCTVLNYACSNATSNSSQAAPSAGDTIGTNPAYIPTDETPFGIELLYGERHADVSAYQGYGKFGLAGGSIAKENSFFSNASNLAAAGIVLTGGTGEDINRKHYNLAFSIPLFKKKLKRYFVPYLGSGVKYYRQSKNFRESYGIMLAGKYIHMGLGLSKNESNTGVLNANIGIGFSRVVIDYSYIKNLEGISNITHIFSSIVSYKRLSFIGAYRVQKIQPLSESEQQAISSQGKTYNDRHYFLGVQYKFKKILTLGIYHNYLIEKKPFVGAHFAIGSY